MRPPIQSWHGFLAAAAVLMATSRGIAQETPPRFVYIKGQDVPIVNDQSAVIGKANLGSRHMSERQNGEWYLIYFGNNNQPGWIKADTVVLYPLLVLGQWKRVQAAEQLITAGEALEKEGKYNAAAAAVQSGLTVIAELVGKDHPQTAWVQVRLGAIAERQGDTRRAEGLYRQALATFEAKLGKDHVYTGDSLNSLAGLLKELGRFAESESLHRRSLEITESTLGKDHPNVAVSLNNLGELFRVMGRYGEAEQFLRRSLEIIEAKYGKNDVQTAKLMGNLAVLYATVGRLDEAEPLLRRCIELREAAVGKDHPELVPHVESMGSINSSLGRFKEAEQWYRRGLRISESKLGNDHPRTAACMSNLGSLYAELGQYNEAETLLRRSLEIRESRLGKDHLDTANSLINLGELLVRTKKYDEAMSLHRRCLAIRETRLGNDHRDTLTVLNNIACIHDEQKQHDEAIRLHQRVLTTVETTLGKDHDDVARMTHNLARALLNVRRYDEAEQLLLRSIALIESRRGRDHPDVTHGLGMLADLHFATDRAGEGRRLYDRLLRSRHRDVTTLLPAMSQSQQHAYLETRVSPLWRSALSAGYWHGRSDSAMAELSAAWVANGKGMQQEALAVTTQLQSLDDPQARAVSEQLRGVRQMLTKVKAEPVRPGLEAESRKELDRLEQRERDFATQLLKLSGRTGRGRGWADIDSIRKSLPDGGVLIDFAFLLLHDFKRADSSSVLFVAWVTPQRGAARVVDLGPAAEIVALSHALQAELAKSAATIRDKGEIEAEKALRPLLQAMAKRLLDPLMALDEVKNARQWVICPDGNLWAVPWAALTLSDGKYAVERYPIRLVNAGRDLVVSADQASTMETSAPLIVSDPDFDLGRDDAATKTREIVGGVDPNQSRNLVSRNLRLGNVKRLPNTAIEAESITPRIAELLKQPPRTFFGDQALEAVVKSAKRPKMLVLSTHGFFLPEQEIRERGPEARGAHDSSTGPLLTKSGDVFEDPLLRCGLLLAACNDQPKPGQVRPGDDGILTGLEVLGLDLRGCELVVLSACETGVSNVRFGEGVGVIGQVGVAGLRQAFQLAGAEAVLASLWQVPDRETALLMIGFFDQLAAGADRPTALAESQRAIIKRRRERSAAAHPFFWAAFTLTGRDIGTLATLKTAHDYNERGRKFLASRADALALADFDAALKLDPKFARAYHNRGVALKNSNKIDEALDSFNKAIELDSNNAAVYRDRSLVYRDRKRYAEALADLDKAVPLDDEVEALIDRAYVHRLMKNFELAKADAAAALKKAPNVWRAWMEKGIQAEFHEKKPDDAIAAYTKSIELNPRASAAYYRRGLVHLSRNAGDKSLKDFEAAVTITPNYLAAREELAKLKSRQGDSRGAVVEWREVIRLAPKSANARWGLGNDLRIAGQVAESIQQMDEALKLNPSYPDAFAHRGVARRLLGQLTEAEADLKKAIELYPKYAWAFNELGTVHLAQKRADDAIGAFDKAIELVPKYVAALRSRAASHRLKGDEVAAKADENRALEAEHGSLAPLQTAAAYIERGRRFLNNRAYELALTDFDAAIKLDANSAVAHYNRGLALDNRGQHAPAIAAYSRAIELDPKNANYYRQRADLYTFRKQYTEALADLTAGIPFDSGVTLLLDRAQLYRQLGKADLAKADGDAALAKSPKEARAWVERGVQADNGRRFDEAVEAFSKALEFEPRNWIALYNRGRIQSNHGKLAEGRRDLEKALEYHPTHLGIRINLAEIKEAAGDLEGGIAERREVVRRSPKSATHRVDLAERLRRANRFPDAIAELDEALRIDPNSADAYSVRAMTRTENQELAAAEADALKALQLSPKMALAMRSLGFIRLQQNRLDECIDLMTQAIALEPSSPRAYDVRAVAHRRAGNLAAAQADEAKVKELLAKPKR